MVSAARVVKLPQAAAATRLWAGKSFTTDQGREMCPAAKAGSLGLTQAGSSAFTGTNQEGQSADSEIQGDINISDRAEESLKN